MSHVELIAATDAMIDQQKSKAVRVQPAGGPADGRDAIELTQDDWEMVRQVARKQGVVVDEGDLTLSREEGCRLAHALRLASTPNATVRRLLVVLGKNGGLMVTGVAG